MATSLRTFLIELHEEHLEEASFLYEQRRALYQNSEVTWKRIGEFEERLEAHIDALVVGDKLALDVCRRRAAEGHSGELFAATCVFCRQNQRDLVLAALEQLDPADPEKASALADALKYELPEAWWPDFRTLLAVGDPKLAPILARAFGHRRAPCGPELLTAARRCSPAAIPELVWALGRIRYTPAKDLLFDYLESEDAVVCSAAAMALARMGERDAIDRCLDRARSHAWPLLPLGLAGKQRALATLTELAQQSSAADCLLALGLLGDPASVPLLLSRLEQPDAAAPAAIALQAITGAALSETVFIPEEVSEDELFESEREQWKQGKSIDRGDGRPFGSTVTRLSQNPGAWNGWWRANETRFSPGARYRNGSLHSPERLTDMLSADDTPHPLRKHCSDELVTRYGKDFGFEIDMPVARQVDVIAEAAAWSQSNRGQFHEGDWYFAGTPV